MAAPMKRGKKKAPKSGASKGEERQPTTKKPRKSKCMNKKERDNLVDSINSVDLSILNAAVLDKLNEQLSIPDKLKHLVGKLCENEKFLEAVIVTHRDLFISVYKDCKKGPESHMNFQLSWHRHCSAFLLGSEHSLSAIKLEEFYESALGETRRAWLEFSAANGVPVPESNPIMITVSAVIYNFLLEHVAHFQTVTGTASSVTLADSDDVHYRFGGAAICDMLHLRYKQIKSCKDEERDVLSQEISVLQGMNTKDKTKIPGYLRYRDRGYMYFPDACFLPCIEEIDTLIKGIVNSDGLQQKGDDLIKVSIH